MEVLFTLSLPRDESSVPVVRHLCRKAMLDLGVREECVDDISVVVTEACSNVLKHARGTSREYEVVVELNGSRCEIRVLDRGGGFDNGLIGDATEVSESGRGIALMRALSDAVDFSFEPESGTIVRLVKFLDLRRDALLLRRFSLGGVGDGGSYTGS